MLYIHSFTGDGSTKLYSVPSRIINERHVEVYVNATGGTITNRNLLPAENYDIAFNSIIFKDAPTKGAAIQVRTATNPDELLEPLTDLQAVAASLAQIQEVATNISSVIAVDANLDAVVTAEANALLAKTKAVEASESANKANASQMAASQSALAAAQSKTNAGLSELAAKGYANDAKNSELLAKDWASKGYGEKVADGLYSARHYAIIAEAAVGGNLEIGMLADATIDTPIDGQLLTYDSTIGKWVNKPLAVSLNDIKDVEANGTVQDGDILRYNATTQRYELYKLSQLLENVDMGYIS